MSFKLSSPVVVAKASTIYELRASFGFSVVAKSWVVTLAGARYYRQLAGIAAHWVHTNFGAAET